MRRLFALFGLLAACHHVVDLPDGGGDANGVVVNVHDDADVEGGTVAAPSVAAASLRDLDGGPPPHARLGGVLMCQSHSVWTPPPDFTVAQIGHDFVARRDDRLVGVALVPHADDVHVVLGRRFVDGEIVWDEPVIRVIDDWHAEGTFHGTDAGLAMTALFSYAGIDSSGKPRPRGRDDGAWFAVAKTRGEADALVGEARKNTLMLVDHACECGDDCDRRSSARLLSSIPP